MALTKIKSSGIESNAIVSAVIANESITGDKIAANTITLDKFEPNVVTSIVSVGANPAVILANDTIFANVLIPSGQNAVSVGPITLVANANVTISSGQRWIVL